MNYTEKIEWIICDRCGGGHVKPSVNLTGWLEIHTWAVNIVADTRETLHLCVECKADFDKFWENDG